MLNYIDTNGIFQHNRYTAQSPMGNSVESGVQELPENPSEGQGGGSQNPVYYEIRQKKKDQEKSSEQDYFSNLPQQRADQLMTRNVVSFHPETLISEAWKVIKTVSFRHIPVIDENRKVLGMVSYNSLVEKLHEGPEEKTSGARIKNVMRKNVLVISPDTPVRSIALNLFNKRIGAMPVTDSKGILQGIITRSDILRAFFIKKSAIDLRG